MLGQKLSQYEMDRKCMLLFDGMTISEALVYNSKEDLLVDLWILEMAKDGVHMLIKS